MIVSRREWKNGNTLRLPMYVFLTSFMPLFEFFLVPLTEEDSGPIAIQGIPLVRFKDVMSFQM